MPPPPNLSNLCERQPKNRYPKTMRLLIHLALLALPLSAALPPEQWLPIRWPSNDPASLTLLQNTPINTLLLEEPLWTPTITQQAKAANLIPLATIHPGQPALPRAQKAINQGFEGVVLEGNFTPEEITATLQYLKEKNKTAILLGTRNQIPLDPPPNTIIGTYQGVWAGINPHDEKDGAHAAPSGAPWIDTNAGFLRFVRASTQAPFWLSATPPRKPGDETITPNTRYLQAIADAAMVGARWIISFDKEFNTRLLNKEARALRDFKRSTQLLAFFEEHRALQALPAYGQLAVLQDVPSGGLLSGSVLDMITVKHTPVRPIPLKSVVPPSFANAKMAVNVDPAALGPAQRDTLKSFARAGGTVLTAPPGWQMPAPLPGQVTLDEKDVKTLDQIWKEVNAMTGRRNLGARLFNVSSMLSNLIGPADGSKVVLYLVNYSDFPVDSIAVHLLGKFSKATVYWPERKPKAIQLYDNEDGSGADIDILESAAILIAEK
jgi:hypothetical protein